MNIELFKKLFEEDCISEDSFEKVKNMSGNTLFSLHWEIKTLLYLGVMLLSSGLGILIYKNIDTIGHQVILLIIAAISAGCFFYCFKNKKPFSKELVKSPNSFFDYILLLGCLSFLSFVGYLQFQYTVFGTNYGMATFIPMVMLFYIAYQFDHLGILAMGITNMAIWMGVSVTPKQLLLNTDFNSQTVILTYLFLGLLLLLAAHLSTHFNFKKHFRFTYQHFGVHLSFISLLAGYFFYYESGLSFLFIITLFALAFYIYKNALKHHSFYFLLLVVLYTYIAVSSLVLRMLFAMKDDASITLSFMYFIASAIAIIFLLINLNKKIKAA
ncbi:DUF2157 domain-containing protein [Pedobacter ginsengisoli]|uniref:DUF2157 domain-containing protein n=1 Tax=Pedobacter ginsengisoli TaxID=363852 RepID=A0A2D1U9T7_9SPHI|nr:DUF2157 domain-containing protein [Pedobacter ginsengisoli]ATP58375.1 DUF2157 domain-containing protein [Pedobacter ginsengisoli]